ncbi:MAG TPA: DUF1302 family protein, partial [Nitrospira sp.]|nr:DUF1302 family protein [Nitrospira sp.]
FGLVAFVAAAPGQAAEFDTGINGLEANLRVDLRYIVGVRTASKDPEIAKSTFYDGSDNKFDRGEIVSNRIDAVPAFQLVYSPDDPSNKIGLRISGSAFYDHAYHNDRVGCRSGNAPAGIPPGVLGPNDPGLPFTGALALLAGPPVSYCDSRVTGYENTDGSYSDDTNRRNVKWAELQDAFVFGNFLVGDGQFSIRAGNHALFWGEALLNPYYGVSYAQGPVDLNAALTIPAIRAQDLFVPVNQVSGTWTPNETFSIGFQYFLPDHGWRKLRAPEGGTFLGPFDALVNGPDSFYLANLGVLGVYSLKRESDDVGTNRDHYGLSLKANIEFPFEATVGVFYREFDETLPWLRLSTANAQTQPALIAALPQLQGLLGGLGIDVGTIALPGSYRLRYPTDTKLYGLTVATQQFGLSFGFDLAYSENRALNSQLLYSAPFGQPDNGERARGKTLTTVANVLHIGHPVSVAGVRLWDSTVSIMELGGGYLMDITSGREFYKGVGTDACRADAALEGAPGVDGDTVDGCSSRYNASLGLVFQPAWYQVWPGIDMNSTLFALYGLHNTSPVNLTDFDGKIISSLGVGLTFYDKLRMSVDYHYYYTQSRTGQNLAGEDVATSFNFLGNISDRDWLSLTLQYSF